MLQFMEHALVSVVIVNYNTFEVTCECIRLVKEKTQNLYYEIIVVDNASKEIDPDMFLKYFPEVILIKSETNVGFARGNNLGVAVAKGEFILLLNSDAFLQNNVALLLVNFLKEHPDVAAVTGHLRHADGRIQHNCQRFPSIRYQLFELFRLQKIVPRRIAGKILYGSFFDYKSVAFPDWIWGTCFMFSPSILKTFPGNELPTDYFLYVEDVQWCMEFRQRGYKVAYVPNAQVIHLLGKSGGNAQQAMKQNLKSFIDKYYALWHRSVILFLEGLLLR